MKTAVGMALIVGALAIATGMKAEGEAVRTMVSLDGEWRLAVDPGNVGIQDEWWAAPRADAKPVRVPWIIQEAYPGYHGVAWYWRTFDAAAPAERGRGLLWFWAVDYKADVWFNDTLVGTHEGGESPFVFDVTDVLVSGVNRVAVRVLNPTDTPIDGIVLKQTPHRNKTCAYHAGASFNHGGITDSVELVYVPAVSIQNLFVRADAATGAIHADVRIRNAQGTAVPASLELRVAPASEGATLERTTVACDVSPLGGEVTACVTVAEPHHWDLNDPHLYRVTARVSTEFGEDEWSARTAFRDFRFESGYFRLNGRRLFLRGSHTGNHCPIGQQLPYDPDLLRRDLVNVKAMGFNMIRFIAGVGERYQLDLCDELGLLVYEESYAGWCLENSLQMTSRYDESVLGMVYRDRNHPSIVMWGLLNETNNGYVFQHAKDFLPTLRAADDTRVVLLNSGRWDGQQMSPTVGLSTWRITGLLDPNVAYNGSEHVIRAFGVTWDPGQLSLHPGAKGEFSAVRWIAPADGACRVAARFASVAEKATTDMHILHNGAACFDALIHVDGQPDTAVFEGEIPIVAGDALDFVVGFGSGGYGGDSTGLTLSLQLGAMTFNASSAFSAEDNPNGPWQYGVLQAGETPDSATFQRYEEGGTHDAGDAPGSLSNPGSMEWERVLHDQHCYPRVPHTADIVRSLREYAGGSHPAGMGEAGYDPASPDPTPIFLSEYGIGSAVDLVRVVKLYEQLGAGQTEDGQYYRAQRDAFLRDWTDWNMAEAFGRPEDYFAQCIAKMADQRSLGLNAIRSNPNFVAYGLTGTVDQGMTGEGLATTFREPKPGTFEALFDGFAPLRWCLFAEPAHLYRGGTVRLEAVLANEDALLPGTYDALLQVFGPDETLVFERTVPVTIPAYEQGSEPPIALPVFREEIATDWPAGSYRFVASFRQGAAPMGMAARFDVADPAQWPTATQPVMVWGKDDGLRQWLTGHLVSVAPFDATKAADALVLVGWNAPADAGSEAFLELAQAAGAGAVVVFLTPGLFAHADDPAYWVPLSTKGRKQTIGGWLYLKDEWLKKHPFFEGLPSGGLMDYRFYRELIPDLVWSDLGASVDVLGGANKTSQAYLSGVTMAVSRIGNGAVVLNTLRIRENLDGHPAAGRILLNIVRHARTLPETGKAPVQNAEALLEELRRRWRTPVVPENSSS